jgi:hypothetical protein
MSKIKPPAPATVASIIADEAPQLLVDLRQLIEQSRRTAVSAVNASLTLMYWHIGQRISTEVLAGQRAGYGEHIVVTLSRQLVADYGRGFEEKNLRRMLQFADIYPSEEIVVSLTRQLSWTHFLEKLTSPKTREFA